MIERNDVISFHELYIEIQAIEQFHFDMSFDDAVFITIDVRFVTSKYSKTEYVHFMLENTIFINSLNLDR